MQYIERMYGIVARVRGEHIHVTVAVEVCKRQAHVFALFIRPHLYGDVREVPCPVILEDMNETAIRTSLLGR